MTNPELDNQPGDYAAREEANKILALLHRRGVIKPTQHDYQSAHDRLEKQRGAIPETKIETKNLEDEIDVALFDWDGVLFDSIERITRATQEILHHFGIEIAPEEIKRTMIQPYWDFYLAHNIPAATEEERTYLYKLYHDHIMPRLNAEPALAAALYPETIDTLRALKSKGIKIGIVSAHKPAEIKKILEENSAHDLVDYLIGLAHTKTEAITELCDKQGFDKNRVMLFGDLPSDIRDAHAAGIRAAAVARFDSARHRLGAFDPNYLFTTIGPEIFSLTPFRDTHAE